MFQILGGLLQEDAQGNRLLRHHPGLRGRAADLCPQDHPCIVEQLLP